jgi:excisionase family DNA binding protein
MMTDQHKADPAQKTGFAAIVVAADFLSLSRNHTYGLVRSGVIPSQRFGRSLRIPWRWLHAQADCDIAGSDATR